MKKLVLTIATVATLAAVASAPAEARGGRAFVSLPVSLRRLLRRSRPMPISMAVTATTTAAPGYYGAAPVYYGYPRVRYYY